MASQLIERSYLKLSDSQAGPQIRVFGGNDVKVNQELEAKVVSTALAVNAALAHGIHQGGSWL